MEHTVARSYKARLYPSRAQRQVLRVCFGHRRWVWNQALAARRRHYRETGKGLSYSAQSKALTAWRQDPETEWLTQCPRAVLEQSLNDLNRAYVNFFEGRAKYPRQKRRRGRQSVRFQIDARKKSWDPGTGTLTLPGLGTLDVHWSEGGRGSRRPQGRPLMATISMEADGRYFVSVSVKEPVKTLPVAPRSVGVDVNLGRLAVPSHGAPWLNPKPLGKALKRLRLLQRKSCRARRRNPQWRTSKRYQALQRRIARVHRRVRDIRHTHLHALTTHLVRENQVIVVETLAVKHMVRNRRLARHLSDAAFGELRRQLTYKSAWYGRELICVDRWYPSSQLCSTPGCDYRHRTLRLSERIWQCPTCGETHDRDVNAARNLLAEGLRIRAGTPSPAEPPPKEAKRRTGRKARSGGPGA